jgi:hypothetical protein
MLVFTVVALRLLALWLIATSAATPIFILMSATGLINVQADARSIAYAAAFQGVPLVLGLLIFIFSRQLAKLIVKDSPEPSPQGLSERTFTQLAMIAIGLFALTRAIPRIGGPMLLGLDIVPYDSIIEAGLGVLLIVGSGLLAGLAGWLRNISPAERHRG